MVRYRLITTLDPDYAAEQELRNRVLRMPLGLELSKEDLRGEDEQLHIVGLDERGQVIACVLIAFPGAGAKVRQIAVDEAWRGQGIGAELIQRAEAVVRERGMRRVLLHARVTARGFFEKLGYSATSAVFIEVAIPHIKMEKDLPPAASTGSSSCCSA